jgi:hypothetical protein
VLVDVVDATYRQSAQSGGIAGRQVKSRANRRSSWRNLASDIFERR